MKNSNANSFNSQSKTTAFIGLLSAFLLASSASVKATEDPPNCSLLNGGLGATTQGAPGFDRSQAHVGDTVPLHASLGMVAGGCRAINATGSIYIATGLLTNFLINVTLDPGTLITCPGSGVCQPGPYNLLITPALVGAGVSSPNGALAGVPKTVQIVQNAFGTALTGEPEEMLFDFHSRSIAIVTPCIQVVEQCAYAAGTNCFPAGGQSQFAGYVTNCGDIQLTNVTVLNNRTVSLTVLSNGVPALPAGGPYSLSPGGVLTYSGNFAPSGPETCAGLAASTVTVRGTDITAFGGPNASVTNQTTSSCSICNARPNLVAPAFNPNNNKFEFTVAGQAGLSYVVQVSTNLATPNWLSLSTNAAPFTFVESKALQYPMRFYRTVLLPCL